MRIFLNNLVNTRAGQSLVEVVVALAIFALISATMVSVTTGSFSAFLVGGNQTQAELYAEEGMEGVRAIRDRAWNELTYAQSDVTTSSNAWQFVGEGTSGTRFPFTRTITLESVCRDGSNNVTTCPGTVTDLNSKKVTVDVAWQPRAGTTSTVERVSYLTNWDSRDWTQTDWSGGSGQTIWSNTARYDSDSGATQVKVSTAGQITLATQNTTSTGSNSWPFTTSTDYTYNASKIAVGSGVAQLVDQGGGGSCGGTPNACTTFVSSPTCTAQSGCSWSAGASATTTNPNFTSNANGWTYTDWIDTNNKASGAWSGSNGNPTGNIRITIGGQKNLTISGYYYQAFTVTGSSAAGTLQYNYSIPTYNSGNITSMNIYVFVDSSAGAPVLGTEVDTININGSSGWVSRAGINVSSRISTPGTYYVKFAFREVLNNNPGTPGTSVAAFDNASVSWTNGSTCSGTASTCASRGNQTACTNQTGCSWTGAALYPTDNPTITPTSSYSNGSIIQFTSFTESATTNGGQINYQLSSDNGTTWKYWDGASWATAGIGNYNSSSTINSNISSFSTSTGQIMFKAFLISNGSQQVILDNVGVGFISSSGGTAYATSGNLTSSAFNMSEASPVQIIEWDESKPAGTDIQLQLRTAPDSSGSPGTWTSWYGASGIGTYFTNYLGALVSTALNGNQWVQYRVVLSGNGTNTPTLSEVRVNYK